MKKASTPKRFDDVPLPRLSDDAAVEIYHFLEYLFDLFEARYGDQISRFYEDRSRHNLVEPDPNLELDDPPF
ncbi:hypothetical protein [Variovorax sp. Varisp62]|uniref:hypothetical protein n=1 Tax=Variovorax sp. Varisp62 TaxID=3243049 RepID=UPI0039B59084